MGAAVSKVQEGGGRRERDGEQRGGLFPDVWGQFQGGQWIGSFKKREEQDKGAFVCFIGQSAEETRSLNFT